MTSKRAKHIIEQNIDCVLIHELPGNPNFLGWFLFQVDGKYVAVTEDGELLQNLPAKPEEL